MEVVWLRIAKRRRRWSRIIVLAARWKVDEGEGMAIWVAAVSMVGIVEGVGGGILG